MRDVLYLVVTADAYELPLLFADSPTELAALIGKTPNAVSKIVTKGTKTKLSNQWCKIVKVPTKNKRKQPRSK